MGIRRNLPRHRPAALYHVFYPVRIASEPIAFYETREVQQTTKVCASPARESRTFVVRKFDCCFSIFYTSTFYGEESP